MKRLPLLLCILLTGLVTPVFGKLDGTYMNEARNDPENAPCRMG